MTLNSIWSWGSSCRDLGSVEYYFIAITPRFPLTQISNLFGSYTWVKYICLKIISIQLACMQKKKLLRNNYTTS